MLRWWSWFLSCVFKVGVTDHFFTERSLPTEEERTPPIVPIRGCLEKIRRMLKGDEYIGRGSSQRGLGRSPLCNTYKVSVYGRKLAIQNFAEGIRTDQKLREHLPRLAAERLVCHCLPTHWCHADSIIAEYTLLYPEAYDREDANGAVPSSPVPSRLAQLRLELDSSQGSSPDEGPEERLGVDRTWKPAVGGIKLYGTGDLRRSIARVPRALGD